MLGQTMVTKHYAEIITSQVCVLITRHIVISPIFVNDFWPGLAHGMLLNKSLKNYKKQRNIIFHLHTISVLIIASLNIDSTLNHVLQACPLPLLGLTIMYNLLGRLLAPNH